MPWDLIAGIEEIVRRLLDGLGTEYKRDGEVAVHGSATVETGALLKGPLVVGPDCFLAAGSLVRGGCWIDRECIIGPGAELKSTLMFQGSKLAHFNFVGDSLLGQNVNIEAGAIIANYRNEFEEPNIRIRHDGETIETSVNKFGALVGDRSRIGANAVIAPGAILAPDVRIGRLTLVDQRPSVSP